MDAIKRTLSNGLNVILKPDAPHAVTALQLWVNAGSADEPGELRGISHAIEHLLFKGTHRRSARELNLSVERAGGLLNAFTSLDQTGFHLTLPTTELDLGLEILAELTQSPKLAAEDWATERQVILEELSEDQDSPESRLGQRVLKQAFVDHPYGEPIIGTVDSLKRITIEAIKNYYRTIYVGSNMTLVLVGNFDPDKILHSMERHFTHIPTGQVMPPILKPKPLAARKLDWVSQGLEQWAFELAFAIPPLGSAHGAALDTLAYILGGSEHSRLYTKLCQDSELVRALDAHCFTAKAGGLLSIRAVIGENGFGKTLPLCFAEIAKVASTVVTKQELELAKFTLEREQLFDQQTVDSIAQNLAYHASVLNDSEWEESYLENVRGLSPVSLQRVAQKYLNLDQFVLAGLTPKHRPRALSGEDLDKMMAKQTAQRNRQIRMPAAAAKTGVHPMDSGLTLIHHRLPDAAVSALYLNMPGGMLLEQEKNAGIGSLALSLLARGSKRLSEMETAYQLSKIGADFDATIGRSNIGIRCDLPSSQLFTGIELLGKIVLTPTFSNKTFAREREFTLQELKSTDDQFEIDCYNQLLRQLFPDHPYGFNPLGTITSLKRLKAAELKDFYYQKQLPQPISFAYAGPHSLQEITAAIKKHWRRNSRRNPPILRSTIPQVAPGQTLFKTIPGEKAYLYMGFPTAAIDAGQWPACDVLCGLITGFGGGTLYQRLREELGLAYSVQSFAYHGSVQGYLAIYVNMAPANIRRVMDEIRAELERLRRQPMDEIEMQRAKNFITGTYATEMQKASAQATTLAINHQLGLPVRLNHYTEAIAKVQAPMIVALCENLIRWDRACISLLAPAEFKSALLLS